MDTNDASAYWRYGVAKLSDDPWAAGDAFYWAIQINPTWADAYYGQWVAQWLEDPAKLVSMMSGDEGSSGDAEARQIDSLHLKALTLNPFLYQRLQRAMIEQLFVRQFPAGIVRGQLEILLQRAWNVSPSMRAISAYSRGNYPVALAAFDTVIMEVEKEDKDHPPKPKDKDRREARVSNMIAGFHLQRGRIFYLAGNYDSAEVELTKAAAGQRKADDKEVVRIYESKAIIQQSIGITFERMHMPDSAREAYGRALQEDLSYAPAHLALSSLALSKGDTVQALGEMELAAQKCPPTTQRPRSSTAGHSSMRAMIVRRSSSCNDRRSSTRTSPRRTCCSASSMTGATTGIRRSPSSEMYISLAMQDDPYVAKAHERLTALSPLAGGKP